MTTATAPADLMRRSVDRLRDQFAAAADRFPGLRSHLVVADPVVRGALDAPPREAILGVECHRGVGLRCRGPIAYSEPAEMTESDLRQFGELVEMDLPEASDFVDYVDINGSDDPPIGRIPTASMQMELYGEVGALPDPDPAGQEMARLGRAAARLFEPLRREIATHFPSPSPPLRRDAIDSGTFYWPGRLDLSWWLFVVHHVAWAQPNGSVISGERLCFKRDVWHPWEAGVVDCFPHPSERVDADNRMFVSELDHGAFEASMLALEVLASDLSGTRDRTAPAESSADTDDAQASRSDCDDPVRVEPDDEWQPPEDYARLADAEYQGEKPSRSTTQGWMETDPPVPPRGIVRDPRPERGGAIWVPNEWLEPKLRAWRAKKRKPTRKRKARVT